MARAWTSTDSSLSTANKLIGQEIFLDEASVTATENTVMAAVRAEGKTVITNAASEPHIQDLCNMLNAMGAQISGIGSNILTIVGVNKLTGTDFRIGPDYMEIGSFIGLAAVTHGSITITDIEPKDMRPIRLAFGKLGIRWIIEGPTLTVSAQQDLQVNCDLGGMVPKIDDAPWPGFPPDLTSIMTVVATQVEGTVLIHEKMFESRMFFVDKLIGMGARITLCDPHRAVVSGPSVLHGSELVSPDVRAGNGNGDCGALRAGRKRHKERVSDREGIRKYHRAAGLARRAHRARNRLLIFNRRVGKRSTPTPR